MPFYESGAAKGGFETGVRAALEAILASPHFIFRLEKRADRCALGRHLSRRRHRPRVAAVVLHLGPAARPGADRRRRAAASCRRSPASRSTRAACSPIPRSSALADRFAAQWLRLQDVEKVHPGSELLSELRREPRRRDAHRDEAVLQQPGQGRPQPARPADAPTTRSSTSGSRGTTAFKGVIGNEFRRVTYPDTTRRGILGQGSMLVQTSLANRTSPVLRGKWVMEVLLGTPPPPPPPDIPGLEEAGEVEGRPPADDAREDGDPSQERDVQLVPPLHGSDRPGARQLRRHRASGAQRENGMPLDTAGDFYDGTKVDVAARADRGAREAPDAAGAQLHREPDGLRRSAAASSTTISRRFARSRKAAEAEQLQDVLVHPGRRQERRVPDAASGTRSSNDRTTKAADASSD